ncbi:MAG TPA: GTP-dependent dephospho-CoA kinase family protein [Nitrososphaera sp.]|nr:GTP-dependent dephospho-CoA kinase family protein [Nitrososphaera sp.]
MPSSEKDLELLKQPFGTLIPDGQVTKQKVAALLNDAKKVIAVGDATSDRLVSFSIIPDLAVIDGRERRSKRSYSLGNYEAKELQCTNLPGTISIEAVSVLRSALASKSPVRILIDGEEDLLALPLFVMAPEGSVVLYGQPLEGLVVVRITATKQNQAKDLIKRIFPDLFGLIKKESGDDT